MRTATDVFLGKRGEPALNLVQPRRGGGSEVNMETRAPGEPGPDRRRLVRAIVVHRQMHIQSGWHIGVDRTQELQKFAAAMAADATRQLPFPQAMSSTAQTESLCRGAYSRGYVAQGCREPAAGSVAFDPAPESGFSRPRIAWESHRDTMSVSRVLTGYTAEDVLAVHAPGGTVRVDLLRDLPALFAEETQNSPATPQFARLG